MRIFIGILGIIIGIFVTLYHKKLMNTFGRIPTVERYLRSFGGSRLFYQLLGVVIIIIATLYMTGLHKFFLEAISARFFGG